MVDNKNNYLNFIKHNKSIFSKIEKKNNNLFLIEFNGWQGVQIANSYLVNSIPYIKNCRLVAYDFYKDYKKNNFFFFDNIKWFIGSLIKIRNFEVYASYGVDKFLIRITNYFDFFKAKKITKDFFLKKKTKRDIENFSINGVWIGDLIYDSYLKKYNEPTIDLNSKIFLNFFSKCIENFLFWEKFFEKNKVKGISVSHVVYLNAIPLRIAVKKNIDVFHCVDSRIYKIDKKSCSFKDKTNGYDYHFKLYKKIFKSLSKITKNKSLKKGKKFLKQIISGDQQYFYFPDKKIAKSKKNYFLNNKKKKIVIFAHSFFDSPHVYGNFLFPDFYEWLKFLVKISKKTNFDWYIKPHPNYDDNSERLLIDFLNKNTEFKIIDKDAPVNDLVKQGMFAVLTVYGSCASELPFLGVKVVNADKNNPHSKYNFCFNPKNLKEFENTVLNLDKKKLKFKYDELYEFHYMNQFYFHSNLLFENIGEKYLKEKNRQIMYSDKIYNYWLKSFSKKKHFKIINSIRYFHTEKDHHLSLKHTKKYDK
jgi:hypothetical protein